MPAYLAPFLSISTVLIALVVAALTLATARLASTAPSLGQRSVVAFLILGLALWLVAAFGLGLVGTYVAAPSAIPTIEFGILVPIVVAVSAYLLFPEMRQLVRSAPQQWLITVQLYRMGGAVFLALWTTGLLPGIFAAPAAAGDILVGLLALLVGLTHARFNRRLVLWWNILGLCDLALALTLGFVTTPSRFQLLALDAPSTLVTQYPLVLIPTFVVPLSILLHLASLVRLSADRHR
jgi:hypothetical protein